MWHIRGAAVEDWSSVVMVQSSEAVIIGVTHKQSEILLQFKYINIYYLNAAVDFIYILIFCSNFL